jgi:nitroimidazol reductase NimA-like FMN-containing flavoprotein (pyridoxamine 5'-phosphate oxidase superfamily)
MPALREEIDQFMKTEWLATLATVDAECQPHLVPVYFTYDGEKVYIQTDRASVKVRNLLANPQVAVAVCRGEEAVVLQGTAAIAGPDEFRARTWEYIYKYTLQIDENGRDTMGIPLFDEQFRCVVVICVDKILFW